MGKSEEQLTSTDCRPTVSRQITNSLLTGVLLLSCVVHGSIYGRFMGFYVNGCSKYGRFPSVDQSSRFAGVPNLGKPLYREKTVYINIHKTATNRPMDHTGEK